MCESVRRKLGHTNVLFTGQKEMLNSIIELQAYIIGAQKAVEIER